MAKETFKELDLIHCVIIIVVVVIAAVVVGHFVKRPIFVWMDKRDGQVTGDCPLLPMKWSFQP